MKKQLKRLKRRTTIKIKKEMKKTKKLAKPVIHVTITRKILGKAPEKFCFNLTDGRKLRNIAELIDELETMSEETFRHFVNDTENHFANWIQDVFNERKLADELRHTRNRIDTQRAILKHLVRELAREVSA